MPKRMKYPHNIETDHGNTIVKKIASRQALKCHKCPECECDTEMYEEHLLLLPTRFPDNRRYMHTRCYEELRSKGLSIILHPNLEYIAPEYYR